MALSFRKTRKQRCTLMSEMNVTPMIDVMLVLLVIFMVTAPMMQVGVNVNLPSASAPSLSDNETPVVVSINSEGRVYIGDIEVDADTIGIKLKTMINNLSAKIYVKGDRVLNYGKIMNIMGHISSVGFKKVVLITELPKKRDRE